MVLLYPFEAEEEEGARMIASLSAGAPEREN